MKDNVINRGLGITRVAMGLLTLARPQLIARGLGVENPLSAESTAFARMFGIRDVALAILVLGPHAQVRRAGLRLGVLADSADALFIVRAARNSLPFNVAGRAAGFAALCAFAGLAAQYRGE
jgi:uncharacterized protein DUF4267